MEGRKQLWTLLPFSQAGEQSTVYDLLVSLKMKGQDANAMVETIGHIASKMQTDRTATRAVLDFLELGKVSPGNYSTMMFLCDQLVEGIEEDGQLEGESVRTVRELLAVRE